MSAMVTSSLTNQALDSKAFIQSEEFLAYDVYGKGRGADCLVLVPYKTSGAVHDVGVSSQITLNKFVGVRMGKVEVSGSQLLGSARVDQIGNLGLVGDGHWLDGDGGALRQDTGDSVLIPHQVAGACHEGDLANTRAFVKLGVVSWVCEVQLARSHVLCRTVGQGCGVVVGHSLLCTA